jgi:hypothetical protein
MQRRLHRKQRRRGFDEATCVQNLLVLNTAGGDCLGGFDRLLENAGQGEMPDHELPSPEAGWWPYREDTEAICECAELPWDPAERKAGEALQHVLKNELAAGVMPHNVLTGLKRTTLKPEYPRARPERLPFQLLCSPGKPIRHARRLLTRVGRWRASLGTVQQPERQRPTSHTPSETALARFRPDRSTHPALYGRSLGKARA